MAGTNGFNPAGFYGVAFDHLEDALTLATTEAVDVLAAAVLRGELATLAVTEPVDVLAASVAIIATADLAVTEDFDVLVVAVTSITYADLSVTEDFFDTFVGDAYVAHMFDLTLVELTDVTEMELATTANVDLEITETTHDTLAAVAQIIAFATIEIVEDPDTMAAKAGRWEFFYEDSEAIRVLWEKQKIAVQGPPRGAVNRVHAYHTAFNSPGFYEPAFFTGTGAFDYSDKSAIRVPPPETITERLREARKSYVEPRLRH